MRPRIYNSFTDKNQNEYNFETYAEFARFWFGHSYRTLKLMFPENFNKLQNYAANSKEARTKLVL